MCNSDAKYGALSSFVIPVKVPPPLIALCLCICPSDFTNFSGKSKYHQKIKESTCVGRGWGVGGAQWVRKSMDQCFHNCDKRCVVNSRIERGPLNSVKIFSFYVFFEMLIIGILENIGHWLEFLINCQLFYLF